MNNKSSIHPAQNLDFYQDKERMNLILSTLNAGLALINPDLTVAWINEMTRSILPWEDLIGKTCLPFTQSLLRCR